VGATAATLLWSLLNTDGIFAPGRGSSTVTASAEPEALATNSAQLSTGAAADATTEAADVAAVAKSATKASAKRAAIPRSASAKKSMADTNGVMSPAKTRSTAAAASAVKGTPKKK